MENLFEDPKDETTQEKQEKLKSAIESFDIEHIGKVMDRGNSIKSISRKTPRNNSSGLINESYLRKLISEEVSLSISEKVERMKADLMKVISAEVQTALKSIVELLTSEEQNNNNKEENEERSRSKK